jgi:ABC-type Mn2+/Zn2+ transport system ATPase subunit
VNAQEAPTTSQPAVSARGLSLGYDGRNVLNELNFDIPRGELVGLLGVSGAGKSTLLGALAGADVVTKGRLEVGGRDPRRTSHPVGLVPQLGEERWGPLCVEEVVALGLPRRGLKTSSEERRTVRERLDMLGLDGYARRRMYELSGGQRQRVSIARALTASPGLLLCDEPTSGADPVLALEIVELLRRVTVAGTTVLVATHDLGVVVPRLDRVLGVAGGKLVADATGEEILTSLAPVYGEAMAVKR